MKKFSSEEIETIKNSVNIVDIIGRDVTLSKSGKNYHGLCPFHNEKTPSFSVNEEHQFFHCFGCGKSGSVFDYLMLQKNIDFIASLKEVAEIGNVKFDFEDNRPQNINPNQRLYDIHQEVATLLQHFLINTEYGVEALAYLKKRGITSEIIEHFKIGFNPPGNQNLLEKILTGRGYTQEELLQSGIFNQGKTGELREIFYNRIIFPLYNEFGQVIAFSGRAMSDNQRAKYLNSPQTKIFNKSYELFHLNEAKPVIRKTSEVFVMEGFMDVIAAYKVGVINTVASMGTSLTENHITRLIKTAKKIIFAFDGDDAGINAAYKAVQLVNHRTQTEIVTFPERLDPDEYLKKYGTEALVNLLQHARTSEISFLINFIKNKYNLANETEQLSFVEEALPLISRVKSLVEQDVYLNQIIKLAPMVSKESLLDEINQNNNQNSQNLPYQPKTRSKPRLPAQTKSIHLQQSRLEKAERQLLARVLKSEAILRQLIANEKFNFKHVIYQKIYVQIITCFLKNGIIVTADVLTSLEEDEARSVLTEISNLNLDDKVTEGEIQDLIVLIEKQLIVDRLNDLVEKQKQAKENGNFESELSFGLEIIQLQKQIKEG
ncbi:MAG: DNA primase [Streptococcaceae bacterium]|nr:DNA primase [Streptococcaceae bacterium]